jgi:hypothetical protein
VFGRLEGEDVGKPDSTIRSLVVAAIRRHRKDLQAWAETRLWDDASPDDRAWLSDVSFEAGELPILYSVVGPGEWTLFTTRAVEFSSAGHRGRLPLDAVERVTAGNFKGYGRQHTEHLALHTKAGGLYRCPYRTGPESMGTLAAINTLLRVGTDGRTSA